VTTSDAQELDRIASVSANAPPPRAIIRLYYNERPYAFVVMNETSVAQVLEQFVAQLASSDPVRARDLVCRDRAHVCVCARARSRLDWSTIFRL
jgi:hypothetical protein